MKDHAFFLNRAADEANLSPACEADVSRQAGNPGPVTAAADQQGAALRAKGIGPRADRY